MTRGPLTLSAFGGALLLVSGLAIVKPDSAIAAPRVERRYEARHVSGVRYVGVNALFARDLEAALPFAAGDAWRDDLAAAARKALMDYYGKRGFYQASVSIEARPSRQDAVEVTVKVDEGRPCLVRTLWIEEPPGFKSKSGMLRFKDKVTGLIKLKSGDRYDEEFLSERLRELREWLVVEDYILANTDTVRLTFDRKRSGVDVVLAIDYGERVTFGFQGNSVFTKGELNEFIAQVRATGLGKDYVGVIQRRFNDEYLSRAHLDVKVGVRSSERPFSKHVTFVFNEGPRAEIESVKWEGLSDQNVAVAKAIFQKGASRLVQRGYFVEKDFDKGILIVLEDLRSRGFLAAKLVAKSVLSAKAPQGKRRVRIVVQLVDGEQTLVSKLSLDGFSYFGPDRIASILGTFEGQAFNPFALEEGLQRLRAIYLGEGFLDFKLLNKDDDIIRFGENNRTAAVDLRVSEGARVKVGDIRISGLRKTRESIVRRELEIGVDDWWIGAKIQDTEANLMKLGIFIEAKASQAPSARGAGYRDLLIDLKEADPGVLEAGPGFRSDLGARAFARVSYNNLLGRNWIGALSAEANRRIDDEYRFAEYKFDASFVEPRFLGSFNQYSLGLSTKKQRFPPDFNAVTTTFTTGFERKITGIVSTKLFYKLERIRQFDVFFQNRLSAIDNRSMLIGSFVPAITLDTRDNPFTTTQGWLATVALEYAHPRFSGQGVRDAGAPGYQKWTASLHRYTPITKDIVWSKVVAGGFARSDIAGREIPLIKLFRLGGYSTIRGFSEDAINVDEVSILGTLTFLNLRTQVDLPLVGDLKFSPFLDAGNLYIDRLRGRPFFRSGAGVGLHYMTPVGPINLDWGHKINPVSGESPNQIHFSVGLI